MGKDLNRIKIVLAEHKCSNKRLAELLGKDPATVSKWCTNAAQPGLETLSRIAEIFDIDIRTLIVPTKVEEPEIIYMRMPKVP